MTSFKSSGPDPRRTGRASNKASSSHARSRSSRRVKSRSALKETKDFPRSDGRRKPSRRQRGRGKENERRGRGKERKLLAAGNASEAYPKYKQMFEDLLNEMEKDGIDCSWRGLGHRDGGESLTGHCPLSVELVIQDPDGTSMHEEIMNATPGGTLMLPSPRSSPGTARRNSSPSRSNGGSRRSSRSKETAPSEIEPRSSPRSARRNGNAEGETHAPVSRSRSRGSRSPRARGLFGRIRRAAGAVRTKCLPAGVHTYKLGEKARYGKVLKSLLSCVDLETCTIEVEIVAVHVDAVLEMPYYTIKLPDETRKNTTGDNLLSLSEYERASKAASSRSQSTCRSRQRVRSSSRGRCSWRSLSRGKRSGSPARGRSESNSSTQSIRCANGDVVVPHAHRRPRSNSPAPRHALPSTAGISPAPNAKKSRERSPSPFRRNLSCSKFLFFDEELNINFFPVGGSPGSAQF